MMGDGKALQMGTSHELGQNFAKAFHTQYLSTDGEQEHVWQTSWGARPGWSAALVMMHGDDNGCGCRRGWRRAGRGAGDQGGRGGRRQGARDRRRAAGGRAARRRRRPHRHAVRPSRGRLGAQGRAAAGRDRSARPGGRHRDAGPPDPRRQGAGADRRPGVPAANDAWRRRPLTYRSSPTGNVAL